MAGTDAGTAWVTILPKVSGFSAALHSGLTAPVAAEGKKISTAISQSLTAGKAVAIGAFAAIGAAAFKGLSSAVSATQDFGGEVLTLRRILGTSAEDSSRLAFVLHHFGIEAKTATTGLGIFEKNLVNGTKFVKQYGLSLYDANGAQKPFLQVLGEAADKFVSLPAGAERAAFAMNVFGRSGKNLIPILSLGAQGIADLAQEADKFGLVLTSTNLEAIRQYGFAQRDLAAASTGLKLAIGTQLIPVLTSLDKFLTQVVTALQVIPAPIKAAALAAIGLVATLTALGIVVGVVSKALGNLGISFAANTVATEANTVATSANVVAHGGVMGLFGKLPGLILPVAVAYAAYTAEVAANSEAQKQAEQGHKAASTALKIYGLSLDIASAGTIPLTKWVIGLFKAHEDLAAGARDASGEMKALTGDYVHESNAAVLAARANGAFGSALESTRKFMGMSMDAFKKWRISTREAANGVEQALGNLSQKAHVSAGDILKSFDRQIVKMGTYQRNWQVLLSRNLPQDMAMQIQSMGLQGAGIVAALAHANQQQFNKIIGDWRRARGEAAQTTGAIKAIGRAAEAVAGDYNIVFHVKQSGSVKPVGVKAHGGAFVPRFAGGSLFMGPAGPFIAGEASYPTPLGAGAEIASQAGVLPLGRDMIDRLGQAVARAGGSTGDADAIGRAVATHLWRMMKGSGGDIVLRVRGRDLVAVVRQEELMRR